MYLCTYRKEKIILIRIHDIDIVYFKCIANLIAVNTIHIHIHIRTYVCTKKL